MKGAPWTVKTVTAIDQITTTSGNTTFTMVTAKGFAHAPSSGTTSTAALSGVVQMVTPVQIVTNLSLGSSAKLGGSVSLLIHFIPEPGLLMLLGSGVVGLAFLGSRRMRK
ncbi:MAG: PEP-CTERM sorting domain-containing protein [Myxococcales bacterium]|nr:PEP-CTERM sorting domain-containing protein [Myxococcales bacterium]